MIGFHCLRQFLKVRSQINPDFKKIILNPEFLNLKLHFWIGKYRVGFKCVFDSWIQKWSWIKKWIYFPALNKTLFLDWKLIKKNFWMEYFSVNFCEKNFLNILVKKCKSIKSYINIHSIKWFKFTKKIIWN